MDTQSLARRYRIQSWFANVFFVILVALVLAAFVYFFSAHSEREDQVGECVRKGVEWYRDTGSYPYFKTYPNAGRRTEDVVEERCRRSTTAFDFVK